MSPRLIPPPHVEPRLAESRRPRTIGWKTLAAFMALAALAVAVFTYLPRWVETPSASSVTQKESESESGLPAREPASSDPESTEATRARPEPNPDPAQRRPTEPSPATPEPFAPPPSIVAADAEFTSAMSRGMAALNGQDYVAAKTAFEQARAIRPEAVEAQDALAQAEERLHLAAIAEHRERAGALEADEDWRRAETEYDSVLALEPTMRFAREGKERTARRAELSEHLSFHLSHLERLSDDSVLKEASALLGQAASEEPALAKHAEQMRELREALDAYSSVVVVDIVSDGRTEVTVFPVGRVGRIGAFQRRSLELRPGRYTVTGTRAGYRDVRRELVVKPGPPPEPFVVRCEEKI